MFKEYIGQDKLLKKKIFVLFIIFIAVELTDCEKKKCEKPWRTFRSVCFMFSDTNT
ncbi:unnamed protein product, partial [Larinioides sclopetarius]